MYEIGSCTANEPKLFTEVCVLISYSHFIETNILVMIPKVVEKMPVSSIRLHYFCKTCFEKINTQYDWLIFYLKRLLQILMIENIFWNKNGKETFHLYFTYYSSKVDLAANSHHMHQKQYFYADVFMITAASINYWPWIGFEQVQVQ